MLSPQVRRLACGKKLLSLVWCFREWYTARVSVEDRIGEDYGGEQERLL